MSVKMIASKRYYRLEERREYAPREAFLARDDAEADRLERTGKAVRAQAVAASEALAIPKTAEDIVALRGDYETMVGKRPFMGWDAAQIREKMASYKRRDLKSPEYSTTALKAED